jgi:hypothetical protein
MQAKNHPADVAVQKTGTKGIVASPTKSRETGKEEEIKVSQSMKPPHNTPRTTTLNHQDLRVITRSSIRKRNFRQG